MLQRKGALPRAARLAGGHPWPGAGRRGRGARPRRDPLRGGRPRDGRGRRRRPGGAGASCTSWRRCRCPSRSTGLPAGGLPEVFMTAHDALFSQAGLRPGEHLLVHGAAGGVGTAAVQLGRVAGARVTATVRREELRAQVEALGARAIDPEGFEDEGPFDVVLELVGASNLAAQPGSLAMGRPDRRHRRRRHRPGGRDQPPRRDAEAGAHSRLDAPLTAARGEGDRHAAGREARCSRISTAGPSRCRSRTLRDRPGGGCLRALHGRREARQDRASRIAQGFSRKCRDSPWASPKRLSRPGCNSPRQSR